MPAPVDDAQVQSLPTTETGRLPAHAAGYRPLPLPHQRGPGLSRCHLGRQPRRLVRRQGPSGRGRFAWWARRQLVDAQRPINAAADGAEDWVRPTGSWPPTMTRTVATSTTSVLVGTPSIPPGRALWVRSASAAFEEHRESVVWARQFRHILSRSTRT